MQRGPVTSLIGRLGTKFLVVTAACLAPTLALAQEEPAADAPEAEPPAPAEAAVEAKPESAEGGKPAEQDAAEPQQAAQPQEKDARADAAGADADQEDDNLFDGLFSSGDKLGWDGSLEVDVGYASYTYDNPNWQAESIYDFRGRFVAGPVLEHPFGDDYFFRATGQLVAWVREFGRKYQYNVDDVYGQVGQRDTWDLKVGRFEAWEVYHRGMGFDVYTLEDTGAQRGGGKYDDGAFGVYRYELNMIHRRDYTGRAAVHYYPLKVLGFEVLGAYGADASDNSAGVRGAADLHLDFLRVSAGAEHRFWRRTQDQTAVVNGVAEECEDCYKRKGTGYGGSAVLMIKPIEVGFSAAKNRFDANAPDGQVDLPGSFDLTSFGGWLQVDPGWLLFKKSLILGVGAHRTEKIADNNDFEQHTQGAAYIAYPLGFNNAMVKLVFSTAELIIEQDTGAGSYLTYTNKLASVRTRLSYNF